MVISFNLVNASKCVGHRITLKWLYGSTVDHCSIKTTQDAIV